VWTVTWPSATVGSLVGALVRNYYDESMRGKANKRSVRLALLATAWTIAAARTSAQNAPEWLQPFPPHRIMANIYYVGSQGLAAYLITTPEGHILINSNLESSLPQIQASIETLGFQIRDVKILLISHAHFDHCAGSAKLKEATGARYMVMEGDVPVVESGGKRDFQYGHSKGTWYRPTKVDRVLHDGDEVKLGGTVLVAHLTAGHTKGTTTWTMKVSDAGKICDVVIVGSPNVNPGYQLVHNAAYPQIAQDYERSFRVLNALPCDVFLGAHGSYYGMEEKFARLKEGQTNPFVDREGYKKYVAERARAFRAEWKKQAQAKK
jgi:metallo-beta-lactamase class B